jgi:hypothetical protein
MKTLFGGLIEFSDDGDFETFINNIDKNDSMNIIEMAILQAQQSGLYTLDEAYSLFICLRKIKHDGKNN